jgi:hypothetical protein
MLNRDSIHLQMKDLNSCSTQHLPELKELMELYPYSSSLVTLYLKSLANDQDLRFNSQLEKFAYQIPNRELLYGFLTESAKQNEDVVQRTPDEVRVEIAVEQEIKLPVLEESEETVHSEIEEVLEVVNEQIEASTHVALEEAPLNLIPELEEEEALPLNIPHQLDSEPEVEALIQSAVIGSSYLQMAYPDVKEELANEDLTIHSEEVEQEVEEIMPNKTIVRDEPKTFTDWLKMGEILDGKHEEESEVEKKPSFYHFEKPKKEFYSPLKKAKESVSENAMPVSETLAQIFALQGNINKAIQVYEQLSLSFPEKKSFFASQIRNLKRKLNS